MDAIDGFLSGLVVAASVFVLLCAVFNQRPLSQCAEKHDVYKCEWVVIPVKGGE